MKTVLETIQDGAAYLEKGGVENGRLNMERLLGHILGCGRMQLYVDFDRPLGEPELAPLRELVRRRRQGEPLQHLIGTVEFHGRTFRTDARALVPRQETEELVERVLARIANDRAAGKARPAGWRVLDVGTGSGVIGLSLAAELGESAARPVVMTDVCADALALAAENAASLGLADRVEFRAGDLFEAVESDAQFDLVAANLPYIADGEIAGLARELRFDPRRALAGGTLGTELIRRFLADAPRFVAPDGWLAIEIGDGQGAELLSALEAAASWDDPVVERDLAGRERFVFVRRRSA